MCNIVPVKSANNSHPTNRETLCGFSIQLAMDDAVRSNPSMMYENDG